MASKMESALGLSVAGPDLLDSVAAPMPIRFACDCGRMLTVPDHRAGTQVRCWQCKQVVAAPGLAPPPLVQISVAATPQTCDANKFPPSPTPTAHSLAAATPPAVAQSPLNVPPAIPLRLPPPIPAPAPASPQSLEQHEPPRIVPAIPSPPADRPPEREIDSPQAGWRASGIGKGRTASPRPLSGSLLADHRSQVSAARFVAVMLLTAAWIGAAPAVLFLVQQSSSVEFDRAGLWLYLSLAASVLQAAYSAYLWQLPDRASSAAVAGICLAFTAVYTALAAAFALAANGLAAQWLGLAPSLHGKAAPWCILMLCLMSLVAYAAGRTSMRRKSLSAAPRVRPGLASRH